MRTTYVVQSKQTHSLLCMYNVHECSYATSKRYDEIRFNALEWGTKALEILLLTVRCVSAENSNSWNVRRGHKI